MKNIVRKSNAIIVPLESYLYLQNMCSEQRVGHSLSERSIKSITENYERFDSENGGHILYDGDLGGAIGDPINSYEEGRWTSWKTTDMKEMLDTQDLPYKDIEPQEKILVGW